MAPCWFALTFSLFSGAHHPFVWEQFHDVPCQCVGLNPLEKSLESGRAMVAKKPAAAGAPSKPTTKKDKYYKARGN